MLNTYFTYWLDYPDPVLKDLAGRFLSRRPLKSVAITDQTAVLLPQLRALVSEAGFDPDYYTAENASVANPKTQIEIIQADGTLEELSTLSPLVAAISGKATGDKRFYFPKVMLSKNADDLFAGTYAKFQQYILNDTLIDPAFK